MKKWRECSGRWLLGCFVTLALPLTAHAEDTAVEKRRGDLPRVLLLGDSISMGYDQPARILLAGKATVHRPPENCQSTLYGLKKIDAWLGDKPWDVIHFNWGIWDAHHLKGDQLRTSPKVYEKNLRTLVSRLKATGAKLIWASTTPVKDLQQNGISVKGADIPIRNAIARKVMDENGIPINDLYQKMLPHVKRLRGADGCHYTPEGSAFLAKRVAESVEKVLNAWPTYAKESGPQRPSIVLILADDMGYSDLGCYGGEIDTPHLDALGDRGLRFTQFYNTGRCWPTRASLLTGLYNDQTGIRDRVHELNRRCVTIAEVLRSAGYGTYMVGKWHLMKDWNDPTTDRWPLQRGFDRFYGTPVAGHFFNPFNPIRDRSRIKIEDKNYYVTDALMDNASDYIREHTARRKDDPFFLYVAHFAPHWPLHARPEDIAAHRGRYDGGWAAVREARYERMIELGIVEKGWKLSDPETESPSWADARNKSWEARRMEVHAAMVHRMDHGIGRIVDSLKATGQLENTLIIFLSDNGASSEGLGRLPKFEYKKTLDGKPVRGGNNPAIMPGPADTYQSFGRRWANVSVTPFRKYKAYTHEGGIATPLVVHWPNGISARGEIRRQPGHVIDVMATCVEVSGATYPDEHLGKRIHPPAGVSLVPAFADKALDRDALYFQHLGNRAVRAGKWKLVALKGKPWELYDLEVDRTETANLIGQHPEKAKGLAAQWRAWATQVPVLGVEGEGQGGILSRLPAKLPGCGGGGERQREVLHRCVPEGRDPPCFTGALSRARALSFDQFLRWAQSAFQRRNAKSYRRCSAGNPGLGRGLGDEGVYAACVAQRSHPARRRLLGLAERLVGRALGHQARDS